MTQRARLIDAMVQVVHERGFAHTTVSGVCAQAKVSRATFYELFDGLEDCFLAVMDDGYRLVEARVAQALEDHHCWQDGVRAALASLLVLFDEEPQLARVWLVETLAAGSWALERRAKHLARLTEMVVARWPPPETATATPLAPTAAMQSILAILHLHLLAHREESVVGLLGSLVGIAVTPYLGPQEVRREIGRAEAIAHELLVLGAERTAARDGCEAAIPDLLLDPRARRARGCLFYLLEHPGASNREVARAVGIARDSHASTLLARLAHMNLLVRVDRRIGEPNAWFLSAAGVATARLLRDVSQCASEVTAPMPAITIT